MGIYLMNDAPEPTKIMAAGDWHGNGTWGQKMIHHARKQDCDVIVHVGDFGYWLDIGDTHRYMRHLQHNLEECGIRLFWVDGNHEDHDRIEAWVDATEGQPWFDDRYPSIVHLPRGFRWQWWDCTWLAMGGAHSVDRLMRTPGKSWWDGEHISNDQADKAIADGPADIMICHDCPDGVEIPGIHSDEKLNAEKSSFPLSEIAASNTHRRKLARIVDAVQPKVLIHGHYHVQYVAKRGVTKIVGLDCDGSSPVANSMTLSQPDG